MMQEGIRSLREFGILGWLSYIRMEDPPEDCAPQKGSEDIPFTQATRNTAVRGHQGHEEVQWWFFSSIQPDGLEGRQSQSWAY